MTETVGGIFFRSIHSALSPSYLTNLSLHAKSFRSIPYSPFRMPRRTLTNLILETIELTLIERARFYRQSSRERIS